MDVLLMDPDTAEAEDAEYADVDPASAYYPTFTAPLFVVDYMSPGATGESRKPPTDPLNDDRTRSAFLLGKLYAINTTIAELPDKLPAIRAHFPPQKPGAVLLDKASYGLLRNEGMPLSKVGITEGSINQERAEALTSLFQKSLPETKGSIKMIPVKVLKEKCEGSAIINLLSGKSQERFAITGVSVNDQNALIKMHYIKSIAEAEMKGEAPPPNPDKQTTEQMAAYVADMEIARQRQGVQVSQTSAPVNRASRAQGTVSQNPRVQGRDGAVAVTAEALARVNAMPAAAKRGRDGADMPTSGLGALVASMKKVVFKSSPVAR